MVDLPPAEIMCVAQAIYSEARGENQYGQRAVGHVILNRSKKLKLTPCQVIRQPGQFQIIYKKKYKGKAWKSSWQMANYLGKDPTGGAIYFKTSTSTVKWKFKLTTVIGNHYFYK